MRLTIFCLSLSDEAANFLSKSFVKTDVAPASAARAPSIPNPTQVAIPGGEKTTRNHDHPQNQDVGTPGMSFSRLNSAVVQPPFVWQPGDLKPD